MLYILDYELSVQIEIFRDLFIFNQKNLVL